ncbi:MAG: hypothetical protein KBG48_27730 [Kofleriaceae bacterium]|jgi:hypothetical protein|nr:hypothetical protein [Kofleriaceae bacterium]MBP9171222.1 hypothetical protein [Kofleriaceae bacterium]MBP9861789.1 hypothetical protein [Kofleriaceae bacterium]
MVTFDPETLAHEVLAQTRDLTGLLGGPHAAHDESLVDLGIALARLHDRGFDRTLATIGRDREVGAAALLVLAGYWRAAAVVDREVFTSLVFDLSQRAWWLGGDRRGLAGLAAVAALTIGTDRGVAPTDAIAARSAIVVAMADTSPYLAGLAVRLHGPS